MVLIGEPGDNGSQSLAPIVTPSNCSSDNDPGQMSRKEELQADSMRHSQPEWKCAESTMNLREKAFQSFISNTPSAVSLPPGKPCLDRRGRRSGEIELAELAASRTISSRLPSERTTNNLQTMFFVFSIPGAAAHDRTRAFREGGHTWHPF